MTAIKNKKALTVIIHIAVWSCFLLIPFIFQQHSRDSPSPNTISNHFRAVLISSSFYLIAFYYINTQLLIPRLLFKRMWAYYILCVILLFAIFLYFPEWASSWIPESPHEMITKMGVEQMHKNYADSIPNIPPRPPHFKGRQRFHFFPGSYLIFILVFAISTCIKVIQEWLRTDANKKEIEREKLNTELLFLKSQVNPHFFFNTLNNIYSLAVTGSENTAPAILKLSSIMRYIISDAQLDYVSLESEVRFIKNFIDLQLVRLTDKVVVDFKIDGSIENKTIAPLLFIPFVENAFKYGVSTKENTSINFHLKTGDKKVIFFASNKIVQTESAIRETTGIGINNVKRRLMLLYPDKHDLQIFNTNQTFSIKLEITIK